VKYPSSHAEQAKHVFMKWSIVDCTFVVGPTLLLLLREE